MAPVAVPVACKICSASTPSVATEEELLVGQHTATGFRHQCRFKWSSEHMAIFEGFMQANQLDTRKKIMAVDDDSMVELLAKLGVDAKRLRFLPLIRQQSAGKKAAKVDVLTVIMRRVRDKMCRMLADGAVGRAGVENDGDDGDDDEDDNDVQQQQQEQKQEQRHGMVHYPLLHSRSPPRQHPSPRLPPPSFASTTTTTSSSSAVTNTNQSQEWEREQEQEQRYEDSDSISISRLTATVHRLTAELSQNQAQITELTNTLLRIEAASTTWLTQYQIPSALTPTPSSAVPAPGPASTPAPIPASSSSYSSSFSPSNARDIDIETRAREQARRYQIEINKKLFENEWAQINAAMTETHSDQEEEEYDGERREAPGNKHHHHHQHDDGDGNTHLAYTHAYAHALQSGREKEERKRELRHRIELRLEQEQHLLERLEVWRSVCTGTGTGTGTDAGSGMDGENME